jgi:phosphoenolpyruvate carboxykinase (ATP)
MKIAYTRAMVDAALNGDLHDVEYVPDPVFGVQVPVKCPGVPDEVLFPRNTWADQDAYDQQAAKLAKMFVENFKQFKDQASQEIIAAGPII